MERKPQAVCPFIKRPLEKCYVAQTGGAPFEKVLLCCQGEFENCEIWKVSNTAGPVFPEFADGTDLERVPQKPVALPGAAGNPVGVHASEVSRNITGPPSLGRGGVNVNQQLPVKADLNRALELTPVLPAGEFHYTVSPGGEARCLICAGQDNIRLFIEPGLSINEEGRKRYPERTIFLDGVYSGPPFYDNKARHYSLDHHAGCVRAFTLATCEQAAVMILQGLPLNEGSWSIFMNEPDLDAVLAAWVLFNHSELLRDEAELLWFSMPLLRVEGIIDTHGFDMGALSGLPRESYEGRKRQIDVLLTAERSLKAGNAWAGIDMLQYTRDLLHRLDAVLFPAGYLSHLLSVDELCKAPLRGGRLGLLCRSKQGIYQVETLLKQRHEEQIGIIVLDMGGGRFTLRQVDPFLYPGLESLYRQLNRKDPRAGRERGLDNLWGGSDGIGGSPRYTGSGLSGEEVFQLIQQVYSKGWGKGRRWLAGLVHRLRS